MRANKNLIAYCGLYCGDCFGYRGKLADLARDLRKELRRAKFKKIAHGLSKYFKVFKHYDKTYEFLGDSSEISLQENVSQWWRSSFLQNTNVLFEERV